MNTRKLLALGIALAFTSLAGAGFAADHQKAASPAPTAPAASTPGASTAQAPAGDPTKSSKSKKHKHNKPAPETKG